MPFAVLPDAEIYYEIVGQGPPVVLVSGLGGVASYWQPNLDALAKHYTVMVYDHRGCGRSTRSEMTYSVELLADDLIRTMDVVGLERASLIGHSTGGAIGQIIAAQTPSRVEKLVLYASWAELCPQMKQCMTIRQQLLNAGGAEAYFTASNVFLYPPKFVCDSWGLLSTEADAGAKASAPRSILNSRIEMLLTFDGLQYLPDIKAPTTVLVAVDDVLTPPLASELLAQRIAGARLMTLPYGAHAVSRVVPESFNQAVLEALAA